jgi:GTP cyclohydrolase II
MAFLSVRKVAEADFPSRWGAFRIFGFEGTKATAGGEPGEADKLVALVLGDIHAAPPVVRIHSQCLTGDVFGSLRCDCRLQFELAMQRIVDEGAGIMLYEQKEGRGIGLMAKLQAYELQDHGLDTVEANLKLGYAADCRDYELPGAVLKWMKIDKVRLITNNPEKIEAVEAAGIQVVERLSAEVEPHRSFERYLRTKQEKMGHMLDFSDSFNSAAL